MRACIALGLLVTLVTAARADSPRQVRGETIIIRDHAPGYKPPQPLRDPRVAPKYSDAAIERDAWTRAWLLLDIDEHGVVQRIKWLKRPGHELEPIALERAFGTRFTPARGGDGRAQPARIVFPLEWPSYWWLVARYGVTTRIPAGVGGAVPCRGQGPLNLDSAHPVLRDCSLPDLSKVATEAWIPRPRR